MSFGLGLRRSPRHRAVVSPNVLTQFESHRASLEVRQKNCLYPTYYENFGLFTQAILSCLSQTHTTHKSALDTLLTLRFQTFKESQIVRG